LCPECLIKSGFNTGTDPKSPAATTGFVPPPVDDIRNLFPQLEILELLGKGGMGAVYKARQPALDRLVALKILPAAGENTSRFAERFNREARALARLNHPGIVTVHDFGVAGNLHYLIMEFVDGPNLRQVQQNDRLSPAQALQIIPQICEALQFAHDQGIVHRDIKPENLLLNKEGRIKITDFGIAKIVGINAEKTSLTGARDIVGTPHYMAPEQIETPTEVDHRADIYSLGVVFYEMLTGELPLGKFAAPSEKVQVDVRLDEVVLRSLEKERDRRYQRAAHVKTHVETIAATSAAKPFVSAPGGAAAAVASRRQPVNLIPALILYALQALLMIPIEYSGLQGQLPDFAFWVVLDLTALAFAYIAWGILHYQCWKALPERYRGTSPGLAVGLFFVPFFNLYWAFVTFVRLANGFNSWRRDLPELPVKDVRGLAIAKAILFVSVWTIALIPGLGSILNLADLVVFALYYRGIVFNANVAITGGATRPALAVHDGELARHVSD
jgi:predicted Ser/Thr protein kinase